MIFCGVRTLSMSGLLASVSVSVRQSLEGWELGVGRREEVEDEEEREIEGD